MGGNNRPFRGLGYEEKGIALLQVLLISGIISLLAIRYVQTSQDQLEIADSLENRVRAQLASHSAISEMIFMLLSSDVEMASSQSTVFAQLQENWRKINQFGQIFDWDDGVKVSLQDLNGLLPILFPEHPLWRQFFLGLSMDERTIDQRLGFWRDAQDRDRRSYLTGDDEPENLPIGALYLNNFPQNDKIMRWVFHESKSVQGEATKFSSIFSGYEFNPANAPNRLLDILFSPDIAAAIMDLRERKPFEAGRLRGLLPKEIDQMGISILGSGVFQLSAEATYGSAQWTKTLIVQLAASRDPPFNVLRNN